MNDDDDYIVGLDSFNNKDYKGEDDFVEWMKYEAPLVDVSVMSDPITVTTSSLDYKNWQQKMSSKIPIDVMHTLYPKQMKGVYDDDDLPF